MKSRVQGKDWKEYLNTCKEKGILLKYVSFNTNGNVRIDTSSKCHWCNDYERKIIFNFIKNNKDKFTKDDRTFIANDKIYVYDIFK